MSIPYRTKVFLSKKKRTMLSAYNPPQKYTSLPAESQDVTNADQESTYISSAKLTYRSLFKLIFLVMSSPLLKLIHILCSLTAYEKSILERHHNHVSLKNQFVLPFRPLLLLLLNQEDGQD